MVSTFIYIVFNRLRITVLGEGIHIGEMLYEYTIRTLIFINLKQTSKLNFPHSASF